MDMQTAMLSSCGGRRVNEDTVRILQEGNQLLIFVGDGLGGYAGGAQASQAASDAVAATFQQGSLLSDRWHTAAAEQAELAVQQLQRRQRGGMKTTMVLLTIEGSMARWTYVGDSRLYHFRCGRLTAQTMDHSVSQMAVLMGQIRPEQIRFHEDRNRVLRALGSDNARPDISAVTELMQGDAFLLCTDGFWEYVYEEEMEQLLQTANNPEDWLRQMENLLLSRVPEYNDNYTAAAVFC